MQAFYLARTGRPGPVLVDIPKDIQQQMAVPDWDVPMAIAGYMSRLPSPPTRDQVLPIVDALKKVRLMEWPRGEGSGARALFTSSEKDCEWR